MFASLRARLTAWYAGAFALFELAFAVAGYAFVARATGVRIDEELRRTAARGGRALPLTAKEYAMLEYLARHAGRVVGRAELTEHLWDENHDPFSNVIEVFINRLRKKVDAGDVAPLIHTRRGAGYVLSADGAGPAGGR